MWERCGERYGSVGKGVWGLGEGEKRYGEVCEGYGKPQHTSTHSSSHPRHLSLPRSPTHFPTLSTLTPCTLSHIAPHFFTPPHLPYLPRRLTFLSPYPHLNTLPHTYPKHFPTPPHASSNTPHFPLPSPHLSSPPPTPQHTSPHTPGP